MSVVIETTLGDITVDLFIEERPRACINFLKLCKLKYYNFNLFHTISRGFIAQTGDPTGSRSGGESVYGVIDGESKRYFEAENEPRIKHTEMGLISFVGGKNNMIGSQFFLTLGDNLTYLDEKHCVFGKVVEGFDILEVINEVICDKDDRPYQDVRITHTVVLDDPYLDPKDLVVPSRSPSPSKERLQGGRIAPDEEIDEFGGKSAAEVAEIAAEREAKARATILEMIGDIPDAEIAPPENVLFVCKLNPVTTDDDLDIIFSRFGKIKSCEVIRDKKSGDSLQYAFIEFEEQKSCEDAYFKMDNVLIDDRRIHVDFSQSVSKVKWLGKGRVAHFDEKGNKRNFGDKNIGQGNYKFNNGAKNMNSKSRNANRSASRSMTPFRTEIQSSQSPKRRQKSLSRSPRRRSSPRKERFNRNRVRSERKRSRSEDRTDINRRDDRSQDRSGKNRRDDLGLIIRSNERSKRDNENRNDSRSLKNKDISPRRKRDRSNEKNLKEREASKYEREKNGSRSSPTPRRDYSRSNDNHSRDRNMHKDNNDRSRNRKGLPIRKPGSVGRETSGKRDNFRGRNSRSLSREDPRKSNNLRSVSPLNEKRFREDRQLIRDKNRQTPISRSSSYLREQRYKDTRDRSRSRETRQAVDKVKENEKDKREPSAKDRKAKTEQLRPKKRSRSPDKKLGSSSHEEIKVKKRKKTEKKDSSSSSSDSSNEEDDKKKKIKKKKLKKSRRSSSSSSSSSSSEDEKRKKNKSKKKKRRYSTSSSSTSSSSSEEEKKTKKSRKSKIKSKKKKRKHSTSSSDSSSSSSSSSSSD